MQPILVDRGQLGLEAFVQEFEDPGFALHADSPSTRRYASKQAKKSGKNGGKSGKICD
jgi:hypothetical protein